MAIKCQKKIADTFNNYFTNITQTIVNDIKYEGTKEFTYYQNRQINSTFKIQNVDDEAVKKVIHNVLTKHSCGFDGISSKLLQIIEPVILKSLTMVINQVLSTGIFPDKLKIAKVIPIFKKDDPALFNNYRPISLLPTISKVLENFFWPGYLHTLMKLSYFSITSMDLGQNTAPSLLRLN